MSELVGKVLEVVDQELNAQGKLVESYSKHQQLFEAEEYTVIKKQERVVENPLQERQPPKTTRYL